MDAKCDILVNRKLTFLALNPRNAHVKFPHVFTANDTSKKNWVQIAVRDTITFSLLQAHTDPRGCFIILVTEMDHVAYTLVNFYAPDERSLKFIHKVFKMAKIMQKGGLIICGDFNIIII